MKTLHTILAAAILLPLSQAPLLAPAEAQVAPGHIEPVTIHPPVAALFQCSEHPLGATVNRRMSMSHTSMSAR